jgi:WD40 repeat protein
MEQLPFQENPFRPRGVLRGHFYEVECLQFSPDGSLLASVQEASPDVWIWDVNG